MAKIISNLSFFRPKMAGSECMRFEIPKKIRNDEKFVFVLIMQILG